MFSDPRAILQDNLPSVGAKSRVWVYNGGMKAILVVLDSFGIGNAPDAALYGDAGSNTYRAICDGIRIPNLIGMGLHCIDGVDLPSPRMTPSASYGRMIERSAGKDTTTGHWELCGLVSNQPMPTYPNGFPQEIVERLQAAWGVEILGNCAASGTQIIARLGEEHLRSGKPIVYTSADSVLQIACAESLYPLEKLYEMCRIARKIMCGAHAVGRIIARPFERLADGAFRRTEGRKDFALAPIGETVLDRLSARGISVVGIGKIFDIFAGRGITDSIVAHGNEEIGAALLDACDRYRDNALIFANFVDFDMLYGHRNDVAGYRACLERFDAYLPRLLERIEDDDLLIVTADHGCDPSTPSTDHSRECVPLLIYRPRRAGRALGTISGFDYVAGEIERYFADERSAE